MENKNQLLKELGYSDELIQVLDENELKDFNNVDTDNDIIPFDTIDIIPIDVNEMIINKSEKPTNFIFSEIE